MADPLDSHLAIDCETLGWDVPRYGEDVVGYFRRTDAAVATVEDLASHIADRRDEPERRVEIQLHHETLPRLAETALVDYEAEANVARYRGPDGADAPTEHTDRWNS